LLLSGNVTLFESLVTKSIDLDYFSFNYASAPRLIDPRKKSSRPLGFDVYVKGKEEIRIENDSLNADFDFNLHVMGNKENIGLVGVINASSGDVLFRNHRYRLLKSKLYFDNPYRIAPRIDIEMEGKVLDYDISARLEGSIEEPQFHLRSQPSLSEVDILSLMTMGFVGRYIKDTMNTARTASLEAISNYTHIGQTLIQLLPYKANNSWMHLDEIRLTSLFSKQRGMSLPAFLMGFDIVKGLKLRLKTALLENDNGRIEQSIELERQFNKKMRWRLSWDSEGHSNYGDAGVDLWYRLEL